MSEKLARVQDAAQRGIELCRAGNWRRGLDVLRRVAELEHRPVGVPSAFYSYLGYGIARFDRRLSEGRTLCEHAIKVGFYQPENYLNLARICALAKDRRGAVRAAERGLAVEPGNETLRDFLIELGVRRRPVIPFLSRDNFLNYWLGRVRHVVAPHPGTNGTAGTGVS